MKGILVLIAVTSVAVTAIAYGIAVGGNYHGNVKGDPRPGSGLSFDLVKTKNGKSVRKVVASGLDYTCEGGSPGDTSAVILEGGFPVNDRKFGGRTDATIAGFDPPARFAGRLRNGGRATGVIRVKGELDPKGQPGVDCDTDRQEWRAQRGDEPLEP